MLLLYSHVPVEGRDYLLSGLLSRVDHDPPTGPTAEMSGGLRAPPVTQSRGTGHEVTRYRSRGHAARDAVTWYVTRSRDTGHEVTLHVTRSRGHVTRRAHVMSNSHVPSRLGSLPGRAGLGRTALTLQKPTPHYALRAAAVWIAEKVRDITRVYTV